MTGECVLMPLSDSGIAADGVHGAMSIDKADLTLMWNSERVRENQRHFPLA